MQSNTMMSDGDNALISEIEELQSLFDKTTQKLIKDIKRQNKIMARSDKRQKQEYDELQKRLEEVQELQFAQKELLDSFIKLIASAIDAKSPYTGGHCERVPQLDKATKLETIYNRIHEIRTRFEVIHRDLTIKALQKKLEGEREEKVDAWLKQEQQKLQEEFAIVANANVGAEFMKDEDKECIYEIAKRTWVRNFNDTIGLAHEEKKRVLSEQNTTPQVEYLLSDKPRHIIPREDFDYEEYKRMGFKTKVPEELYNLGELYNLCINAGTLTYEERFKIQEHVQMTIKMLEHLPFPDYLKNVPLFAGAHHETLIGTGYPRQLTKEDMPIPSRIMAIVDVFEALTASDRPYKEPKTLSQSIKILSFMVKDQHLDGDLFRLFLESGVYMDYAKAYLKPEQIDDIDIKQYLE